MDNDLLLIVIGSTIVFLGILGWKLTWLYKKMIAAEEQNSNNQ